METMITAENFEAEVKNSDIPVMVDFFATWCGPCQMMAPTLAAFAEQNEGKVKVCKCDIDQNMELLQEFKIRSVPTVIVFDKGEVKSKSIGALSMDEMADMLK